MDMKIVIQVVALILCCITATYALDEEGGYRNRTNSTFNSDNYKSLYKVSAPASPDIHISYYIPAYPDFETTPIDHSLSDSFEVIINLRNDGVTPKVVKAILAYLANAADVTKFGQTVLFIDL